MRLPKSENFFADDSIISLNRIKLKKKKKKQRNYAKAIQITEGVRIKSKSVMYGKPLKYSRDIISGRAEAKCRASPAMVGGDIFMRS